ncbi:MAG: site-specific integrase [Bacteroidales bacterium]|jgi:site-specific recombinase XerD|nr:site-specific integrase [Bacteroidales bacterium]
MKSTFNILFYLKRNNQKQNGTVPVMGRITVNGHYVQFTPKVDINPEIWSVKAGKAIGRTKDVQEVNAILDSIRVTMTKIYRDLRERESDVTAEKVKNIFFGTDENVMTLLQLFTKYNEDFKSMIGISKSMSSYQKYVSTKNRVEQFLKDKYKLSDIALKDVNYLFIHDFDIYLKTVCRYPQNSTAKHMQRLKTIMILARNNEYIYNDPFAKYKVHFDRVDRGYLTLEEIEIIMEKKFKTKRLEQVRDIFIFSCYTGLAYVDVSNLREKNIRTSFDGKLWIMTKRQKTNIQSNIPLLDVAKQILDKYADTLPDGKVLPILTNQKMNAYLKEIGDVCGIDKNLTFHLARHSFATLTLTKGVSIESVSKMLGHTNIKTTQIYAKITDNKISDDMAIFAQKLEEKKIKQKSNLDEIFECLSLGKQMAVFNFPVDLPNDSERIKLISNMWYNLSEKEKSSLLLKAFENVS